MGLLLSLEVLFMLSLSLMAGKNGKGVNAVMHDILQPLWYLCLPLNSYVFLFFLRG